MHIHQIIIGAVCTAALGHAYDQLLGFDNTVEVERRSIDEIYQAALAEGGEVTCLYGGDALNQQAGLKKAFEDRFPGMTLNITADLSKYLAPRLDRQLAVNDVQVDSIVSQSLHDFPRWKDEGALLNYKPLGFDSIRPAFRDANGAYYGVIVRAWSLLWNSEKSGSEITGFADFLKPEYKNKLALTYPNDDDAILFVFDLILNEFGTSWFEDLLKQNPKWVRGTQTPSSLVGQSNTTAVATFTSLLSSPPPEPFNSTFPTRGQFMSWAMTAAILKDAPHPEGAKLFHAFHLSADYQKQDPAATVRSDVIVPNQPFEPLDSPNTDPTAFQRFMADRVRVERLRFYFEDRLGTPQGINPSLIPLQ